MREGSPIEGFPQINADLHAPARLKSFRRGSTQKNLRHLRGAFKKISAICGI